MAGNSSFAYAVEDSYDGGVTSPTYVLPGSDPVVETYSIDNFLSRVREPGNVFPTRSVAQSFEGAATLSFDLSNGTFHDDLIFNGTNGSSNNILTGPEVPSAEVYLGITFSDSTTSTTTVERELHGWVPTEWTLDWTEGELVRSTLTGFYADEARNTSFSPGTVSTSQETDFHEATFTINSNTYYSAALNSATFTMSQLARGVRGTSRHFADAVRGDPVATLEIDADMRASETLQLAYGGTTSNTSPSDSITSISGTLDYAPGGTSVTTLNLPQMKIDSYDWQSIIADGEDENASETATFFCDGEIEETT